MFDTIQFYYDTVDKFHEQYLLEITNHSFSDKKPHWKARKLSNFWVWTSSNGRLHVRGSLAKYHLGNNIEHLSTEEIEQAVQSLCSKLMIKPEGCKLTQLDIGITFRMNHPVLHYQDCMWYCKYLPRWTKGSSIYFGKESRVLNIYDKLVEADHSGMIIPDSFQEHHLLRYECRYEGNIDERFKRSDSTLDLLYDGLFVHEAIENYVSEFNNIRMFAGLDNSSLIGTSTAEAIKHDYARQLYYIGPDILSENFKQLKEDKVFNESRDYSQFKNGILKILEDNSLDTSDSLVAELTQKVEAVREMFASPASCGTEVTSLLRG